MLRLVAGFVAGVVATFMFFLSGYGDRLADWAKKAEVVAQEIQKIEKETEGARNFARSLGKTLNSEQDKKESPAKEKPDLK
jgi:glycerol dehydrogenase-like iron-containing ADH family enzyme